VRAVSHRSSDVEQTIAVVVGHHCVQRGKRFIDLYARPYLERAVSIADQNCISAAVTKRNDQILNTVAIQVAETDIIARRKEIATGHQGNNRLARECSIADAKQNGELGVASANCYILDSVAIQIKYCHGHGPGSNLNLAWGLKRAISVTK